MKISNRLYDFLKWFALVAIPAIEAFWLTIGKVWNFPYLTEIGTTIAAVGILIAALIGVSSVAYRKEGITNMFNEDLLKDMLGFDEMLHEEGELESEEVTESED